MAALPLIALAGCPNSGKSALFNRLTGSRQKVANYAGVTVERKEGLAHTKSGQTFRLLDLPGAYSLRARSPDEAVTRDVLLGKLPDVGYPDIVICVADATNLKLHLRFALELKQLGVPMILALNMFDIAKRRGFTIDCAALSKRLGVPVVPTVAVRNGSVDALMEAVDTLMAEKATPAQTEWREPTTTELRQLNRTALHLLTEAGVHYGAPPVTTYKIDRVLLHPVAGLAILVGIMFFVFQAVFTWSTIPMDLIDSGFTALGHWIGNTLPDGYLKGFLVDGVIAGVGSVIVFLPQILVLYLFILILEDSGYMARAAFLLDRIMGGVGLHGKSFIPLLSSFACAIPGIMAARTIEHKSDRLITILIAPLMTCSARIPVYTLLIAAFIPATRVYGFNLQGLVMFGLYMLGLVAGLTVALVLKRFVYTETVDSFVMELPTYKLPALRNIGLGLLERAKIFLRRAGGIIFCVMVVIWVLSNFPASGGDHPIEHSFAGMIGIFLAPIFAPIGFNWQMVIALIPGMAAREVAVAVLGTVYAVSNTATDQATLGTTLAHAWSLPSALSFLVWYVFAPQCISTLAVIKRETNSSRFMWATFSYLMVLAYVAALITYQLAVALLA
ncbi:MAG: ferrous iron transport protein B [Pseudomonadota bacterium]